MTELEAARLIAEGKLPSPHKFSNMTLFKVRVTGTGMAYRDSLDEYVWRDPSLYLNDEFLARVGGLPLIWEHPERGSLNSDEFADRVIGTCMFGFIEGNDVWAIARVYDDEAIKLMSEDQLSTSPGVVFGPKDGNISKTNDEGDTLLIEGIPSTLCHLAVCERGVWDVNQDPHGVQNDLLPPTEGPSGMAEEEKKADAEKSRHDAAMNEKLDAIMDAFKSMKDSHDRIDARLDAYENDRKDKARHDAEEKEKSDARKDAEKDCMDASKEDAKKDMKKDSEEKRADKEFGEWAKEEEKEPEHKEDKKRKDARKDAEEEAPEDKKKEKEEEKAEKEEEKPDARKDSAMSREAEELKAIKAQLAAMQSQIRGFTAEVDGTERDALAAAQSRFDAVAAMLGDRAPAPMPGETSLAYRRRVLKRIAPHSPRFKDSRFDGLDANTMTVVEDQVYADATTSARQTIQAKPGVLVPVVERIGGRDITRYHGDPGAFFAPFVSGGLSGSIRHPKGN